MDMLEITGLHKRFGEKQVLQGLDLTVPAHSIFGFIGKNGAGKTTTMKIVLGLLRADAGTVRVAGAQVEYGRTNVNRQIGFLPDVPEFYPFFTAPEYLAFCGGISGMPSADLRRRSGELLELVGLAGETHRIGGFSRGMKQRLGIAQALLGRPRLLICDEPTSALDPVGRKEVLDILSAVKEETTVLLSTHILSDAERICTHAALLHDGITVMQGSLPRLKEAHRSREYRLETEEDADLFTLQQAFPGLRPTGRREAVFSEPAPSLFELLAFTAARQIRLRSLERCESTLESLFMEVANR